MWWTASCFVRLFWRGTAEQLRQCIEWIPHLAILLRLLHVNNAFLVVCATFFSSA
jgi:hypothetical protein